MVASLAICRAALILRPFTDGDLLGEPRVDRLDGADLAAFELLDDVVHRLQGARHAQANEVVSKPLDGGIELRSWPHADAPSAARRLPTAS